MSDTSRPLAQWPDAPSSASAQMGRGSLRYDTPTARFQVVTDAPQGRAGFVLQSNGRYTPVQDTTGQTAAVLARLGDRVTLLAA